MKNFVFIILVLSSSFLYSQETQQDLSTANASPQKTTDQLREAAKQVMRGQLGTWNCRWEMLDAEGNVTRQFEGVETISWEIEDRVLKIETDIPFKNQKSVSLKFFKPATGKFFFFSVDQKGDTWTFHEEVGLDDSWSDPHVNADNSVTYLRFTTLRKTETEFDVLMEASTDEKKNWTKVFRQYLVKQ